MKSYFLLLLSISALVAASDDKGTEMDVDFELVYFDLETTGISLLKSEVLQIAAKKGDQEFSKYILPKSDIPEGASKVNGMTKRDGVLYLHDNPVETTDAKQVLIGFVEFLKEAGAGKPVVLVAHNGNQFDSFIILRELKRCQHLESFFDTVIGFIDTLYVMRTKFQGLNSYKQEALAEHFGISTENSHDALGDVRILQKIIQEAGIEDSSLKSFAKSISQVALGGKYYLKWQQRVVKYGLHILSPPVSLDIIKHLANKKITLEILQLASENEEEFRSLLIDEEVTEENVTVLKKSVQDSIAN